MKLLRNSLLCLLLSTAPAAAQVDSAAVPPAPRGVPVILNQDTLFHFIAPLGAFTAEQRAVTLRERLLELARNPFASIDSVYVVEAEGRSDIMVGELVLTSVTDTDAAANGIARPLLATARAEIIAAALEESAISSNLRSVLLGVLYTLLATAALVMLVRLISHLFTRARHWVEVWKRARIGAVRVQNLEVISADRIAGVLSSLITGVRLLLTLLLGYLYLLLVFSFFPWTRGVAARLVQYAIDPVVNVVRGFIAYIPNLFYIVVIILTTYYVLKLIHLIFDGVRSGAITISGFYPDWAEPTYKIVRFLVIALSVILIWPHLPSSDRPEFKGVAAFLGLLLSLGSAGAVSNVIGGVVMVYMRPFQIGDRVRIADTIGDVVEKNLLVTRVRTIKNVDITIPNSMVLGSHIINYSSTAADGGLVLHTTITLGYDTPWRKVHEVLIEAALACPRILPEPRPYVLQTALNDFNVAYELNAYTAEPNRMAAIYSDLHQSIQDHCAAAGIEILSPTYEAHRDGSASTIPNG